MTIGSEAVVNSSPVDKDCPVALVLLEKLLSGSDIAVDRANTKPVDSNACCKC